MSKFETGQMCMTRGVNDLMEDNIQFVNFVQASLGRYLAGDWGEMCDEDKEINEQAVKDGDGRILGSYEKDKWKIWIITETDRSVTTVLFPSEY